MGSNLITNTKLHLLCRVMILKMIMILIEHI